jgi:hypothetical protein
MNGTEFSDLKLFLQPSFFFFHLSVGLILMRASLSENEVQIKKKMPKVRDFYGSN